MKNTVIDSKIGQSIGSAASRAADWTQETNIGKKIATFTKDVESIKKATVNSVRGTETFKAFKNKVSNTQVDPKILKKDIDTDDNLATIVKNMGPSASKMKVKEAPTNAEQAPAPNGAKHTTAALPLNTKGGPGKA